MPFVENCPDCSCAMGHFPLDCTCDCHEMLRTYARYCDITIEQAIKEIKANQLRLQKDPIAFRMAELNHQFGVGLRALETMRKELKLK